MGIAERFMEAHTTYYEQTGRLPTHVIAGREERHFLREHFAHQVIETNHDYIFGMQIHPSFLDSLLACFDDEQWQQFRSLENFQMESHFDGRRLWFFGIDPGFGPSQARTFVMQPRQQGRTALQQSEIRLEPGSIHYVRTGDTPELSPEAREALLRRMDRETEAEMWAAMRRQGPTNADGNTTSALTVDAICAARDALSGVSDDGLQEFYAWQNRVIREAFHVDTIEQDERRETDYAATTGDDDTPPIEDTPTIEEMWAKMEALGISRD